MPDGVECAVGTDPKVATGVLGGSTDRNACTASLANPTGDDDGDGLQNMWEKCKWNTSSSSSNTDGDTLGDCIEVMDVNGTGTMNAADSVQVKQAFFGIITGDLAAMDISGSGAVNTADATIILQKVFAISPCL